MKYEIKEISASKRKIEAEITAEEFDNFYNETLKSFAAEAELPGFRKGKAPVSMVEDKINAAAVLSEAGEVAIRDTWLKILRETNLEAIAAPQVEINKIAKGNPFEFSIEVEVLPTIELPDIRAISAKVCEKQEKIEVTEKEIEDTLEWLRQTRSKSTEKDGVVEKGDMAEIHFEFIEGPADLPKTAQHDNFIVGRGHYIEGMDEVLIGMKKDEEKEFEGKLQIGKDEKQKEPVKVKVLIHNVKKVELPEMNDEFVKSLGKFETVAALKEDLKKGIAEEKELAEREKKRAEVIEKISEKTKIDVPAVLIEREESALLQNLKGRVASELGVAFEEYLSQIKKTEEDVKKEFKKMAEQRVKAFLVLNEIEKQEKIVATDEELSEKISKIISQYPDPAQAKQEIERGDTKEYLAEEIKREKIFKLLGC
jgi:trigger factor